MGRRVGIGDIVRHRDSGKEGIVNDLTRLTSDDDRDPHGLTIRFMDDAGVQVRCLSHEVDVLDKA